MLKNAIRVAAIGGISINIHVSWILIFVLVTWTLAVGYFPENYPDWSRPLYWTVGLVTLSLIHI